MNNLTDDEQKLVEALQAKEKLFPQEEATLEKLVELSTADIKNFDTIKEELAEVAEGVNHVPCITDAEQGRLLELERKQGRSSKEEEILNKLYELRDTVGTEAYNGKQLEYQELEASNA